MKWMMAGCLVGSMATQASSQGVLVNSLNRPAKAIQTPLGNLLVSEVGAAASPVNSGRVSIVDAKGNRRTLVDGLPSAPTNAANSPSGPSGLFLSGRTLYLAIGEGNPTLVGPVPRSEVINPAPASPIFSSVLAVKFNAAHETYTTGISLSLADHHALKNGQKLTRSDAFGSKVTLWLVTDFPDTIPEPLPNLAENVRHSHPYGVVADNNYLYVVDSGFNLLHKVEIATGVFTTLTSFPNSANPLFGTIGPPTMENVPTSVRWYGNQLLVTLFAGFPFPSGQSRVLQIDPQLGGSLPLISGLTSAIDVVPMVQEGALLGFLTLEFSTAQLAGAPGRLQWVDPNGDPILVLSQSLITPGRIVLDKKTGQIHVVEIALNRILSIGTP
jgi:hypothetical protein